jgi:hypothetical protein
MAYAGGPEDEALLQRSTGWHFTGTPYFYPNNAKPMEQLPKIQKSIDAGLPVVADLPEEFGVLHGYDTQSNELLATSYQSPGKANWMPVTEVGTKIIMLDSHHPPLSRRDAILAGLHAAVANWSRGHVPAKEVGTLWEDDACLLQYGSAAYEEWANDLRHADVIAERSRRQLWTASAFNMTSLTDARWAAAGYLRQAKTSLSPTAASHLEAAASIYQNLAQQLSDHRTTGENFFGVWYGKSLEDWSAQQREKEAAMLMTYLAIDAAAIKEIQTAIAQADAPK